MKYFSKKRFTMRQVVGLLTIVFLGITVAGAGTYTYYLVGWKSTADTLGASESKICAVFAPN